MSDRWMTVKDVAYYLQLSTDQIYRLAQEGRIPVSKVGSRWRFKRERIDRWMEEQEEGERLPTTRTTKKRVRQHSAPATEEVQPTDRVAR